MTFLRSIDRVRKTFHKTTKLMQWQNTASSQPCTLAISFKTTLVPNQPRANLGSVRAEFAHQRDSKYQCTKRSIQNCLALSKGNADTFLAPLCRKQENKLLHSKPHLQIRNTSQAPRLAENNCSAFNFVQLMNCTI